MKVLFDTQIFDWQINGGISRYFIEVLQRLDPDPDIDILFRCTHSYNTYIQSTRWLKRKPAFKSLEFKGKLRLLKAVNEKINRRYSNRCLGIGLEDIFHPTYYDPYFLSRLGKRPFVLTVYDLTHEKFFANSPSTQKTLDWKKELILAANHIVAISGNTKKDVVEYYKVAPEKITTVYLSGGFDTAGEGRNTEWLTKNELPQQYILFVGSRSGYKNFIGFIREVAPVLVKENFSVVIAGGGNLNAEEQALLDKLGLAGRFVAFSHVSDAFLSNLYSNAVAFIFPSLYEGFGIPVLEAMQCGCPALLSDNSSLPEVGGDAAIYFDPSREGSLQEKLTGVVTDNEKRKRMISEGYEQVKKFNWDATARGHKEVYKKLLS
jgi:glycosyltransferase involved in cell wall biosynthesis